MNPDEDKRAAPPAARAEETAEWIVTFKSASGVVVKIEILDSESGGRRELTLEEYGALAAMGIPVTVPGMPPPPERSPAAEMQDFYSRAYYQGAYDYYNYLAGL